MIVPRVTLLGDTAAASRWIGVAKQFARAAYQAGLATHAKKVSAGTTLRVENIFPVVGKTDGISKVRIEAEGGVPVMLWSYNSVGGFSSTLRMMISIFERVKKPYHPIEGRPLYEVKNGWGIPTAGEPYNPSSIENWKWVKEVVGPAESPVFLMQGVLANKNGFRVVGYKSEDEHTTINDQYAHYKVNIGNEAEPLTFLYSTPYWDDTFSSGAGWYLFALDNTYLYEMCSLDSNVAPIGVWFSVRSAATGDRVLYKHAVTDATNQYGVAARNRKLATLTADLSDGSRFLLDVYTIGKVDDVVTATRSWRVTADWSNRGYNSYGNAIAVNDDCVYWLFQDYVAGPPVTRYYKIEAYALSTGTLVGTITLDPFWIEAETPLGELIVIDPYFNSYDEWRGVAANNECVYAVSSLSNFDVYKRTPVYSGGVIVSETYEKTLYIKAVHREPLIYGDYERNAIIAY